MHEHLRLHFLPCLPIALAVTTRHTSPSALKNAFTAVCSDNFCPRSMIMITMGHVNTRSRVKSVACTRNRFMTAGLVNSCLSRSMMAVFSSCLLFIVPAAGIPLPPLIPAIALRGWRAVRKTKSEACDQVSAADLISVAGHSLGLHQTPIEDRCSRGFVCGEQWNLHVPRPRNSSVPSSRSSQ